MAIVADRVKETSITTGTGTLNLDGAVSKFISFVAGIGTGNQCYYAIVHQTAAEWEVGIGTVTDATPDTLSRTTVLASSNAGALVNLSAGTKDVFVTIPAQAIPLTTKGDLYGHTTTNARVPVGTNGALLVADSGASTGVSWLLPATATVATDEATTSNTYTDLTTAGPAVTVTIGASGRALVIITAEITPSGSDDVAMSFAVSGASTVSASDVRALRIQGLAVGTHKLRASATTLLTGLTAGSNTFTAKYRTSNGVSMSFANRDIAVIPL